MSPIAAINNAYITYQYIPQTQYKQVEQRQEVERNLDNDTYEHISYSSYVMYDNQGQSYTNCVARQKVTSL
jgi:hypothetical protein